MSEWLRKGAAQGDANCQFTLGVEAMKRNPAEAMRWFLLAGNQGYAAAQDKIGLMYRDGLGVEKNAVQALMWFTLAATTSGQYFTPLRDAQALQMTPEQIEEAQRRAREWKPSKKKERTPGEPDGLSF